MAQQMRAAAQRAHDFTAAVAGAAADAIEEMGATKADKGQSMNAIIPTTGWVADEVTPDPEDGGEIEVGQDLQYPQHYDIAAQVTENDRADVIIETASLRDAGNCGICPTTETLAGKIRVRAQKAPDKEIRVQCWITKGVTT